MDRITYEERRRIAELVAEGAPRWKLHLEINRSRHAIRRAVIALQRPARREPKRSPLRLSLAEREEISRGLAAGRSLRGIASGLGRAPSTVCREVAANGGAGRYRACAADRRALRLAHRPKPARLARCPRLRKVVESKLELRWSPEQIAGWLKAGYPDDPEMRVSHETIYLSLFVQSRGALRKELARYLRSGRAVPGHWEGDLVFGTRSSTVATLVERTSRFVMLVRLPGSHTADVVADALAEAIATLPEQLRRSITWDQGKEMAEHARFSVATGVPVYFCDPHSPWQRGSNENTNGLLRQYFPRSTDFRALTQSDFDNVAAELNCRPLQTLGWKSPCQALDEALQ